MDDNIEINPVTFGKMPQGSNSHKIMKNRIQSAYKVNSTHDMPSQHGKSNMSGYNSNPTQRQNPTNSSMRIINHHGKSN